MRSAIRAASGNQTVDLWLPWHPTRTVSRNSTTQRDVTPMLLPPDMRAWLPADHLVWFALETVEVLDTSELERGTRRRGGAGVAGYDPRMLLALLVYAYYQGVRSRDRSNTLNRVERACIDLGHDGHDVTFTAVAARTGL